MHLLFVCYLPGLICWDTVGEVAGNKPNQRLKAHERSMEGMEANIGQ